MSKLRFIKLLILILISILALTPMDSNIAEAKAKKAAPAKKATAAKKTTVPAKASKAKASGKATAKSKASSKAKASKKSKKSKRSPKAEPKRVERLTPESDYLISFSDTLADGVVYNKFLVGRGVNKVAAHIIEADISDPENQIAVMKAKNQVCGLEKLQDISFKFDSLYLDKHLMAAVNANFWRAGSNAPIGPVICNGEVVELNSYKNWSTAMFDARNKMYIDRFSITGTINSRKGLSLTIDAVNRRSDTNQIILYNQYGGDSIPYVSPKKLEFAMEAAMIGIEDRDITDIDVDTAEIRHQVQMQRRMETIEYAMPKLVLRYLTPPGINKNIRCVVQNIDSFTVRTSPKTCILSLGRNFPYYKMPRVGDTLMLKFTTNTFPGIIFQNAVCGTPRLVRNGVANHEAEIEGSRSRRFIGGSLPRTAIGVNKELTKVYLVVAEPSSGSRNVRGADLNDMAQIMAMIGCHNAMNLDGGGSSILSINGLNQIRPENPTGGRRISVGLGVVKKFKNKYHREAQRISD